MSVDFSGVTASWNRNPPNYNAGETITGSVVGQAVNIPDPTSTQETVGPGMLPVRSASGAESTVQIPAFVVTTVTQGPSTNEDVTIDRSRPITGLGSRTVTYAADNKSFTVVA